MENGNTEEAETMTATNDKAIAAFIERKMQIDAAIAKLMEASENHFDASPEEINWGHVGDLGRILNCLNEALEIA